MRIKAFRQTAFVTHEQKVLCHIDIEDWDHCNPYKLNVAIAGHEIIRDQHFWSERAEFVLPAVEKPAQLTIEVEPFLDISVSRRFDYLPPKPWQLHFFLSSHEDLGYCAYVNTLDSECADYLDRAIELARENPDYAYMIEHYWWLNGFANHRSAAQKKRLSRLLRSGQIELSAPYCSNHTHWQGYEQLSRSMAFGCARAPMEWGMKPPETVVYADIAGASWGCVSAYRQVGIRYIALLRNRALRFSLDDDKLPPLFWWVAPNGRDRLLCFMQDNYKHHPIADATGAGMFPTMDSEFTFDETRLNATVRAADEAIAAVGDVPYDILPVSFYMDREYPRDDMLRVCRAMNARFQYPQFVLSTPGRTLGAIERRFGDMLPERAGDITDQWADFAAISPEWMGEKRRAELLLPMAEAACVLSAADGHSPIYPHWLFDEAAAKLCEFDDHCWATSSKHPQTMHLFNLNMVKRETARAAGHIVDATLEAHLGRMSDGRFSAWNLLPFERTLHLRFPEGTIPTGFVTQSLADGGVITNPVTLPAFGYISGDYLQSEPSPPPKAEPAMAHQRLRVLETAYYQVTLNLSTQRIESILDKRSGEQLLDGESPYGLGELLYVYAEAKHRRPISIEQAKRRGIRAIEGPLACQVMIDAYEEQLGANVRAVFTFYHNAPDIDIRLSFENASGLMGDYNDRYKKNVFFALPLRMPDHHFTTEVVGGAVDERTQRLPWNPNDFVCAQNWVAVENGRRGIGVFTREMPIFNLGGIHYNKISSKVDYGRSASVFLYAASNRCNALNFREISDCRGTFHLSLLPFEGSAAEALPTWAYSKLYPPMLGAASSEPSRSHLELDAPGVRLLCMRRADGRPDRVFLRFLETRGQDTRARLQLPFAVRSAALADGLGRETGTALNPEGNALCFEIVRYGYVGLLVEPERPLAFAEGRDERDIRHVFCFPVEHNATVLCFEKGARRAARYRVLEDGQPLMVVRCDGNLVQQLTIPGIAHGELTVEPADAPRRPAKGGEPPG